MSDHISDLSKYFETKPDKKTITFSVRDIHITPRGKDKPAHITHNRKSLSQWLFHRMKEGELIVDNYTITTTIRRPPFKYTATRRV